MKWLITYRSLLYTALVAAAYTAVVTIVLLAAALRPAAEVPSEEPEYLELKQQLTERPGDTQLQARLRQLDVALRRRYFRRQRFALVGAYLLAAGAAVTLVAARWAASLRRRLPQPAQPLPGADPDEETSRFGVVAVLTVGLLVCSSAWIVRAGYRTVLPDRKEIARLGGRSPSGTQTTATAGGSGSLSAPASAAPSKGPRKATAALPPIKRWRKSWPRFRGPDGSGCAAFDNLPTKWDAASGEGILWKVPVPLPGANSPIVWEDRVFLSGATAEKQQVYCFDAASGRLLWQRDIPSQRPAGQEVKVGPHTGYAAPTMATDGLRVYVMFATGDVAGLDLFSGRLLWCRGLGVPENTYGHAASLATYRDRVIVQLDQGSTAEAGKSRLLALDGTTGRSVWETPRPVPNSWCSPLVVQHQDQWWIIAAGDPWVAAYRAEDGKEVWRVRCLEGDVGPSPVFRDGMVYVASEFPAASAIRAGGKGDVTQSNILWQVDLGLPDACSPLVTDQFVLLLASYGTLTCYDRTKGGEPLWEEDFDGGFFSSPSLGGGLVYLFSDEGKSWVVRPAQEGCERVAEGDLAEPCVASPAFQEGRIYMRGKIHLFCLGKSEAASGSEDKQSDKR